MNPFQIIIHFWFRVKTVSRLRKQPGLEAGMEKSVDGRTKHFCRKRKLGFAEDPLILLLPSDCSCNLKSALRGFAFCNLKDKRVHDKKFLQSCEKLLPLTILNNLHVEKSYLCVCVGGMLSLILPKWAQDRTLQSDCP